MKKNALTTLMCLWCAVVFNASNVYSQDNSGKEFYFTLFAETFLNHFPGVYIVGNYDATVTIDYVARNPANDPAGLPQCTKYTFQLTGNVPQYVDIPFDLQALCYRFADSYATPETVQNNGIKITSTAPIAVYSQFLASASSEMTPILPSSEMGTDYIVTAHREITNATNDFNARTTIVGTQINTQVTVTLPNYIWTSLDANAGMKRAPGATWTFNLNEGQTYTIISNDNGLALTATPAGSSVTVNNNQGLTGMKISANKPISVMGGADCTWAGNDEYPGCGACDLTSTHLRPTSKWGTRYVTTQTLVRPLQTSLAVGLANPAPPRIEPYPAGFNNMSVADYLFITAKDNGTVVSISGVANYSKTLNAGEWFIYESPGNSNPLTPPPTTSPGATHHLVTANNPIQVIQIMKGWQCDNINPADPSQMLVMAETNWRDNYIMTNPTQYANNFFAFIIKEPNGTNEARSTLNLSAGGANIPVPAGNSASGDGVNGWTKIGNSPYYFQRVTVNSGAAIKAKSVPLTPGGNKFPFAFYASGSTNASSYGYMGGAVCDLKLFAGTNTDTICTGQPITLRIDSTQNGGTVAGQKSYNYTWRVYNATNVLVYTYNGNGNSATHTYTPSQAGRFTYLLELTDIAGCPATSTGSFMVMAPPVVNDIPDYVTCAPASFPTITGTNLTGNQGFYTATGGAGIKYLSANQIPSSGSYFIYDKRGGSCFSEQSVLITLNSSPLVDPASITRNCNGANTHYQVSFTVTGGTGGPYTVTEVAPGGIGGSFTGNVYTSNNIPSGVTYSYQVKDANNCAPVIVSGVKNCNCFTDAGTMNTTLKSTCQNAALVAQTASNSFLDANDVESFVIHTNSSSILGTILASSTTPSFNFIPASMTYGTTYYISKVAGDNNGSGQVNLSDPCLSVAAGTPVVWHQPVHAIMNNSGAICEGSSAQLNFNITGAAPFNLTYSNGTSNFNINNTGSTTSTSVSPTATTSYQLVSLTSLSSGCNWTGAVGSISTTVNTYGTPSIQNLSENCSATNDNYVVQFNITGGQAPFTVNMITPAAVGGTLAGTTWTSNPIPSGVAYSINLNDVNNCATVNTAGNVTCACLSNAGAMLLEEKTVCGPSPITAVRNPSQPAMLDPNDVQRYVLHTNAGTTVGTIIAEAGSPTFNFLLATMQYGTSYYISSVVANNNGSGGINWNDPCLSLSAGTPVKWFEMPEASALNNGPLCDGETVQFTGGTVNNIQGASYSWTGPNGYFSNVQNPIFPSNMASSGVYTLIVSKAGCSDQITSNLNINASANASFTAKNTAKLSDPHVYNFQNNSGNASSYIWNFGDGNTSNEVHPSHGYTATSNTTNVTLIALNGNGCHDTVTLELNLLVIPENDTVLIYMPNTFTPDGNEYNQYFFPVFNESVDVTAYEMKVYNRWGEVIFNSRDTNIGWDGSFKNAESQAGTYTWEVQFRDKHTFKRYKYEGHVNLLR